MEICISVTLQDSSLEKLEKLSKIIIMKIYDYSSFFNAVEKVRQPNIQLSMLPRYLRLINN
jgi:hypothetical protein